MLLFICMFIAALLGLTGLDLITALSGAATAISNVGSGLGDIIGPAGNFEDVPSMAKWISLQKKVIELLERKDYVFFTKYGHYYPNTVVGESYLHKVSLKSTGALKPFKGEWVRIVCIGSGAWWNRDLAAGIVEEQIYL